MERAQFEDESWNPQMRECLVSLFRGEISAQKAAEDVASLIFPPNEDYEYLSYRFWNLLFVAIIQFPEHQALIIEFLLCMSQLPPALDSDGKQAKFADKHFWRDLPGFGMEVNGEWNHLRLHQVDDSNAHVISERFLRANRFTALAKKRSQELGHDENSVFDYKVYCMATMRSALEDPNNSARSLECFIPAAGLWIEILGPQIHQWEGGLPDFGGARTGMGGPLWNGARGFWPERWELWKTRFGEIAKRDDINEETRQSAQLSMERMSQIA